MLINSSDFQILPIHYSEWRMGKDSHVFFPYSEPALEEKAIFTLKTGEILAKVSFFSDLCYTYCFYPSISDLTADTAFVHGVRKVVGIVTPGPKGYMRAWWKL